MKKIVTSESKNIRFEKEAKALKKNLEKRKKQEEELKLQKSNRKMNQPDDTKK